MKKIRYFPFGYHMVHGKIMILPEESNLLKELFDEYLQGASLQTLANRAEQTGIRFRENAEHWNKNMIARMLDDERYWNGDYPPIIAEEVGACITSMREQKAAAQSSIKFIHKRLICCNCGGKLKRMKLKSSRIHWICEKCNIQFRLITDNDLLHEVTNKMLLPCRNPEITERNLSPNNSLSIQAARLTNEINQMLDQREVDTNKALSLILECATEKYKTCSIKESDHLTIKLKTLFQEHSNDEKLDRELFEQTVKRVILQPDGSVQLRLLNDKII